MTVAGDLAHFYHVWADGAYLATLAEVGTASRYHAEGWIGTGNPRVCDLAPGWPVY